MSKLEDTNTRVMKGELDPGQAADHQRDLFLELIGKDDHSEFGNDDDTDFCFYRNELRAELRKKVSEL